jgi:hypothetical protein
LFYLWCLAVVHMMIEEKDKLIPSVYM